MTRPIDKAATNAARAKHAAGVKRLHAIFGFTHAEWVAREKARRVEQGKGRPQRRKVAKAQRIARRRNRA